MHRNPNEMKSLVRFSFFMGLFHLISSANALLKVILFNVKSQQLVHEDLEDQRKSSLKSLIQTTKLRIFW
jgi:hypothetical protein